MSEKPTCPVCGSSSVAADASVYWHDTGGGGYWEISDGFAADEGSCIDCDAEDITFVWVEEDSA